MNWLMSAFGTKRIAERRFDYFQSASFTRYDATPRPGRGNETARVHRGDCCVIELVAKLFRLGVTTTSMRCISGWRTPGISSGRLSSLARRSCNSSSRRRSAATSARRALTSLPVSVFAHVIITNHGGGPEPTGPQSAALCQPGPVAS
jgi:hypothetical protein